MTPLLLALAASAASLDPAPLRASLVRAMPPVISMEACSGLRPRYEDRYDRAFDALRIVADAADSLFGPEPTLEPWDVPAAPEGCGERAFAGYEAAAEAGLAEARRRLAEVTTRMPGLWLGTLRVCREEVAEVDVEPIHEGDGMSALNLALVPALKPRLLAETQGRVGKPLSVRIDGEAILSPIVYEPLSAGEVMLSGPDREEMERIRVAALRPCQPRRRETAAGRSYCGVEASAPVLTSITRRPS